MDSAPGEGCEETSTAADRTLRTPTFFSDIETTPPTKIRDFQLV
jgi:hypothetical protein